MTITETAARAGAGPEDPPEFLRALFDIAVAAADPMLCVPKALPAERPERLFVIGAGKASARMAEALEAHWGPCEGLVITRYGYGRPCAGIEIVEAAHPVPDAAGAQATDRLLEQVRGLGEGHVIYALISGGASALLVQPAGAITLEEKQAVNAALLASGAPIDQMNIVRKHLSRVKGGQLAAACWPAQLEGLLISDVPGDSPAAIASGPTVGDPTGPAAAREILTRWKITVPESVDAVLAGPTGVVAPDDDRLSSTRNRVIAAPSQSLAAARDYAERAGVAVRVLGDAIEGEARDTAQAHAGVARETQRALAHGQAPVLLLSGGECTVTRRGDGTGGPNAEYALALALALDGTPGVFALACDTDGVDGAAEVAGAQIDPGTLARARSTGINASGALATNDSHGFFAALKDQVITGPTLTNVNDFRAILVLPAG